MMRWTNFEVVEECWEWRGRTDKKGYGIVTVYRPHSTSTTAHRAVWEERVGPIPENMTLDHLCDNHSCVNPEHLEVISWEEQTRRRKENNFFSKCGHLFNAVDSRGNRICRECTNKRQQQWAHDKYGVLHPTN